MPVRRFLRPRIIESTTPVLTTVEFSPLAMMCTLSPLLAILAFAPKLAICTSHHYWRHDTVHPMYKRVLAFRYSQSDCYLQRCLSAKNYYSNPCAFTGAANVTVKADTSNPHAITHTGNLRGIPSGCDSGVILTTADASMIVAAGKLTAKWSLSGVCGQFCIEETS